MEKRKYKYTMYYRFWSLCYYLLSKSENMSVVRIFCAASEVIQKYIKMNVCFEKLRMRVTLRVILYFNKIIQKFERKYQKQPRRFSWDYSPKGFSFQLDGFSVRSLLLFIQKFFLVAAVSFIISLNTNITSTHWSKSQALCFIVLGFSNFE